jgi:hypothetical protein
MPEAASRVALEMAAQAVAARGAAPGGGRPPPDFRRLTVAHQKHRYVLALDGERVYACLVRT